MERVGKKYQWIALHEFLARLSDNVHWVDRNFSDLDDSKYCGPWQLGQRDIDPTIWERANGEHKSYFNKINTWWQPHDFGLHRIISVEEMEKYLWDESTIPDFANLLQVSDKFNQKSWTVLKGFWWQKQESGEDGDAIPTLDAFFKINVIFVEKGSVKKLEGSLVDEALASSHLVSYSSNQHEGYLGEYPWHPFYKHHSGWTEVDEGFQSTINQRYFAPFSKYEWESGSPDYSLDSSLSVYLPAKEIVEELGLFRSKNDFGSWCDDSGAVFTDPSINEYGPSYALMRTDILQKWLDEHNLEIVWLIGGEKQMFSNSSHTFHGRSCFNGIFKSEENEIRGSISFNNERPHNEA